MRKTREELIEMMPTQEGRENIVGVFYGDEPYTRWRKSDYDKYQEWALDYDALANVLASDAWIYHVYGDYDIYRTLQGTVRITTGGNLLCGDFNLDYGGKTYYIVLNQMYELYDLKIYRIHTQGCGGKIEWSNQPDIFHTSERASVWKKWDRELDPDVIEKLFDNKEWNDFGWAVQKFRARCREIYESDKTNHFMDKWSEKK